MPNVPTISGTSERIAFPPAKMTLSATLPIKGLAVIPEKEKRRVELERAVDPALVGGFVIRVKDKVVDGSVHSFVRQLRDRLQSATRG